jgi:hypothetical protein
MKYAVEIGSGAMIYSYIQSFIKIGSGTQNLLRRYTDTKDGDKILEKHDFNFR